MRRPAFFDRSDGGAADRLLGAPLEALSWLYGGAAAVHRGIHASGARTPARLPRPVVSVGNLTVGGTGKTPFTLWLARGLAARGHRTAILTRGYGRPSGSSVEVVSDGVHPGTDAERAGDEPVLLAQRAPGVAVVVCADRARAGRHAIEKLGAEVLVLDDGFQHHRLARDLDLVCWDGRAGLGSGFVLPRGPLRERLSTASVADAFVVVDGPLHARDRARIERAAPDTPWLAARRRPLALVGLGGEEEPVESWRGSIAGLLCAIANPDSLRSLASELGIDVCAERIFPDHHAYAAEDLDGLAGEAPRWLTTEKDLVKLRAPWLEGATLRALRIDLEVDDDGGWLGRFESQLGLA